MRWSQIYIQPDVSDRLRDHPVKVEMYFFLFVCAETSHNEVPVASYSEELTLLAATRTRWTLWKFTNGGRGFHIVCESMSGHY